MIQGYAIYLRTHRKTGQQYGGMVWWTTPTQTAEKACRIRWQAEDRRGIRCLFGGFDSKIMYTEKRTNAPVMSEGLYRIRIAVDEQKIVDTILPALRLNRVDPLMQLYGVSLNEAILGVGGRIGGKTQGRRNVENGHLARLRHLQQIVGCMHRDNHTGIFSPEFQDRRKQISRTTGIRMKKQGRGIHAQTQEERIQLGRISGQKHKMMGTGIFAPGMQAKGGHAAVISGQLAAARESAAIKRFLRTVAWG